MDLQLFLFIIGIFSGIIIGTLVSYWILAHLIKTDVKTYIDTRLNYCVRNINDNMRILEQILNAYFSAPGEEWKKRKKPEITDKDLRDLLNGEEEDK